LHQGRLRALQASVTAANVSDLFEQLSVPTDFGLLSLDIDRNTYWVWEALSAYRPKIAVAEYNASLPPGVDWKVEYNPELRWNGSSYFGASLTVLENLGRRLGFSLVGCDFMGVNAFFVRADLCGDRFAEPFTAVNHYEPPRYGLTNRQAHPPAFSDLG